MVKHPRENIPLVISLLPYRINWLQTDFFGEILFRKEAEEWLGLFLNKYSVHISIRTSVRKKLLIFLCTTYPR